MEIKDGKRFFFDFFNNLYFHAKFVTEIHKKNYLKNSQ